MALNFDIDYVLPYVNGNDPVWAEQHKIIAARYGRHETGGSTRYADFGYFRYLFRGLAENLPWLHQVHLIVEGPTQVPDWIDQEKVHIVYHSDFMPEGVLPTYNSQTIEMYLDRIPGLADHFIYANDDMYILYPMRPEDFFTEEGFPRMTMDSFKVAKATTMFRKVCYNEWNQVHRVLARPCTDDIYMRPKHDPCPMNLYQVRTIRKLLDPEIRPHLEPFRNEWQHNQYIYSMYAYATQQYGDSTREFKYIENSHTPEEVAYYMLCGDYTELCLNDVDSMMRSRWLIRNAVNLTFEKLFPNPCKYEK